MNYFFQEQKFLKGLQLGCMTMYQSYYVCKC